MGKRGPKPGAKNAGRPCKDFDQELFLKYCKYMCTQEEIADFFKCDVDTINAWCKRTFKETFSEVYKKNQSFTKISLRRAQIQTALGKEEKTEYLPDGGKIVTKGIAPNPMMQVWLGKQYLGQSDQPVDESKKEEYHRLPTMQSDEKAS